MRPAGLDSLPMGYTRLYFLECTGTQYINTGLKATGSLKISLDVMATAWDYVNYIFGSEQKVEGNLVFSMDYNKAYSRAGMYRYGTQFAYFRTGAHANDLNIRHKYVFDENVVYRDGKLFPYNYGTSVIKEEFTSKNNITLFASYHDNKNLIYTRNKKIYSFGIYDNASGRQLLNYIPALGPTGAPCMFDTVTKKPFYNEVTTGADFIAGMTMEQAIKLKDLPPKTATLNISLPEGYDSYEEVMEAIRQAEEKGWTFNITTHTPA